MTDYTTVKNYTVDRWVQREHGKTSVINNGIRIECTSDGDFGINQTIENYELLYGKTLTLSMKVSAISGTFDIRATSAGNSYWHSHIIARKDNITTTGIHSVTFDFNSASMDSNLLFNCGILSAGSTGDYIEVEWIKLEVGSQATAFTPKPYAEELAMCQRYYWNNLPSGDLTYAILGFGFCASSTRIDILLNLPATLRSSPTIKYSGSSSFPSNRFYPNINGDKNAITAMAIGKRYNNIITIQCTTSGLTADTTGIVRTQGNAVYLELDAEIY